MYLVVGYLIWVMQSTIKRGETSPTKDLTAFRTMRIPLEAVRPGVDGLIDEAQIAIEPVTEAQARIARQAYRDFGKTSGHPAKLNFGDCFSYALAKSKGEPLLFKGQDFSRTDVRSART